MKRIITIAVAILAFAAVSSAQPKAIGIRGANGAELSYQHYLGGSNFAEFDLGLMGHFALFTAIYDFSIFDNGNLCFYAGPGAQVGLYTDHDYSTMDVAVAGQIGLEYNFSIPLSISLDWRPAYHLFSNEYFGGFNYTGAALGLRYRF